MINILDYIDLQTLIKMLGLNMKEKTGYFHGLCPFHQEDNPSFSIKKEGFYKCFSCGESGSLSKLIYKLTGKSAFKFLNINDVPSYHFQQIAHKPIEKIRDSFDVKPIEIIGVFKEVRNNSYVYSYLKQRNLTDKFIDDFNIKYVDYCKINKTEFKKRIMIPIYENKILTGYEGRDYTKMQKPKVLYNSGASVSSLFNYDSLDKNRQLIVCEGLFDIPLIYTYITSNVTHTFGSAISYKQKQQLKEFDDIIYFQDNDEAGDKAVLEFDKFYEKEFRIATPPNRKQDPGDLSQEEITLCLKDSKLSINYFLDKSKLFEESVVIWK